MTSRKLGKELVQENEKNEPARDDYVYKLEYQYLNILLYILLHVFGFWGLYHHLFVASWSNFLFVHLLCAFSGTGTTAGAHRLWTHRAYKAKLPLRILLMIWQTLAMQDSILTWSRDHRVHHKFTDTNADPHNSTRGFFFSHAGWLMVKKHRDVRIKGKTVDMSDVEADPVVQFQKKYYIPLVIVIGLLPIYGMMYFLNETFWYSFLMAGIFRFALSLNATWTINSLAHMWGDRPYDKGLRPTDKFITAIFSYGEAWHNYHHCFPWDYKASEFGGWHYNPTTRFINLMAKIGWAYDLKSVPPEMVAKRAKRTGDGTRKTDVIEGDYDNGLDGHVWGWDDTDIKDDMKNKLAEVLYTQG